ncbi:tat (twin-arginine translocation) pathway signal sequence domain protein [Desulfovibrio sp. A2]|nr:tat (twin-arginine translocation) pathway signal sequence domain protein [Desulfovibrio sp. A2]
MAAWLLLACCLAAWAIPPAQAATATPAAASNATRADVPAAAPALANATRALDTASLLATQPLTPFMEFLVDPTGTLSVDELLSPSHQAGFAPLGSGLPLLRSGSTWLRLTLAAQPANGQNRQLLLDLGRDLPGRATLFLAKRNQPGEPNEWQAQSPEGSNVFTLPDPVGKPMPVYVKLDGVPGPWFAPMLRTAQNAASNNDALARPLVIGVLVAVLALCLLRGLFERGEWRLWTSLFAAAVLAQAVAGQPPTPAGYVPLRGLPGVLAPGLALMLLPHVGRHLLRTSDQAPKADLQLRIVSLAGAVLALLPLVPGMAWASRLLALWPLLLVLVLPAAVSCKVRKLPGSRRFLTGCLAALAGAGVGIVGLASPVPAVWISTAPLWGLALLALLVAGTGTPRPAEAEGSLTGGRGYRVRKSPAAERPDLDDPLADEPTLRLIPAEELRGGTSGPARLGGGDRHAGHDGRDGQSRAAEHPLHSLHPFDDGAEGEEPLELSLGDVLPELEDTPAPRGSRRMARAAAAAGMADFATDYGPDADEDAAARTGRDRTDQSRVSPTHAPNHVLDPLALARMEESLLGPIDAMLQELDGLENCALPPAARSHAEAVAAAGRELASIAGDLGRVAAPQRTAPRRAVFDLQRMLRDAHDAVADRAERKGLAISWFMAPHLSQLYEGDAGQLGELLRLLAESSVRSTDKGSVHMSVRRVPDSTDPGHLLFTVSDSGAGAPPHKRSVSALARAWEMADAAGGTLTVESGRGQGTTVSFTARLVALSGDATAPRPFVGVDLTDDLRVARPIPDAVTAADQLHLGPITPRRPLQVIVADDVPSNRQLLAFFLEGLPHAPLEARGATEAGILYRRAPSGLVIMDGDMPEDDIVAAVASIRAFEQEHDLAPVPVLALVAHEAQADRMLAAGCTETLEKPLTRSGLRAAVERLAPPHAEPEPQAAYAEYGYADAFTDAADQAPQPGAYADAAPEFTALPDLFLTDPPMADMETLADTASAWDALGHAGTGHDQPFAAGHGEPQPELAGEPEGPDEPDEPDEADGFDAPDAPDAPDEPHAPDTPDAADDADMFDDARALPGAEAAAELMASLAAGPTSWHPWDSPMAVGPEEAPTDARAPGTVGADLGEPGPTGPTGETGEAYETGAAGEELPDLFGADIFAVPHRDDQTQPRDAAFAATGSGGALPEGGSLLDLIVTDAADFESADNSGTADTAFTEPATAVAVSGLAAAIPATAASAAASLSPATVPAAWGDDFEESVGEPMPLQRAATPQSPASSAGAPTETERSAGRPAHAASVRPAAEGGEWVGDPMPMEPHRASAHAGPSASSSYGAAARLERWERAQRAQHQGQRVTPQPPAADPAPMPAPASELDTRPIRDLSAEVRPGYRPQQQPAPSPAQHAGQPGQTPSAQPAAAQQAPQPLPPQMPYTRPQPGQPQPEPTHPGQARPVQTMTQPQAQTTAPHSQAAQAAPAAPAKSFAERIAERIAIHLGRGAERTPDRESDKTRRAPARPASPDGGQAHAGPRDRGDAAPAHSLPSVGHRPEPHGHMGDDIEPFIPGLLETLDAALDDARRGRAGGSTFVVQEAAARIAGKADSFGLRVLERIARCVERAAAADDMEAVRDLLPELEAAVERNRIALAPRAGRGSRRSVG